MNVNDPVLARTCQTQTNSHGITLPTGAGEALLFAERPILGLTRNARKLGDPWSHSGRLE